MQGLLDWAIPEQVHAGGHYSADHHCRGVTGGEDVSTLPSTSSAERLSPPATRRSSRMTRGQTSKYNDFNRSYLPQHVLMSQNLAIRKGRDIIDNVKSYSSRGIRSAVAALPCWVDAILATLAWELAMYPVIVYCCC